MKKRAAVFDRQERIAWWNQKKLSDAKVLVIGAGALGNEVIKNLALLGVGQMLIVDFDYIEDSNLSRAVLFRTQDAQDGAPKAKVAATRAKALNPNPRARVNYLHGNVVWDVGLGVYRHADVVVGCLDNIEARLSVNLSCWKMAKTWIDGGIWELAGSVSVYDGSANERACYECGMTVDHYRAIKTRYSCTNAVVKTRIKQGFEPTTQISSAVVGALQSQEAVKILHALPSFPGRRLMFNGLPHFYIEDETDPVYMINLSLNPDCLCHQEQRIGAVQAVTNATHLTRLADFFAQLHAVFGPGKCSIDLGRVFVVAAVCPLCGNVTAINRPLHRVFDSEVVCQNCEVLCPTCGARNRGVPDCGNCGQEDIYEPRLEKFREVSEQDNWYLQNSSLTLDALGIPALHILPIRTSTGTEYVELAGDKSKIWR